MKRILSFLVVFSFIIITNLKIIACQNNFILSPYNLSGQIFNVKINTFNSSNKNSKQNWWGKNSIGSLYSTFWSINNKLAKEHFPIQNQEIAAYLTKGEILIAKSDDGSNIILNGRLENEKHKSDDKDWQKDCLKISDIIIFKMICIIFGVNGIKKEAIKTSFTIKIVA